jgi:hypothetical protein
MKIPRTILNCSFEDFTSEDLENLDFGATFEEFKENASNLLALFECLAVDRGPDPERTRKL